MFFKVWVVQNCFNIVLKTTLDPGLDLAAISDGFSSPASPGSRRTCAELKLAELIVLMCAELNDFPGSDIIAERNDLPDSDIIEYRPYINALIFHMIFRTWNESPKAE